MSTIAALAAGRDLAIIIALIVWILDHT